MRQRRDVGRPPRGRRGPHLDEYELDVFDGVRRKSPNMPHNGGSRGRSGSAYDTYGGWSHRGNGGDYELDDYHTFNRWVQQKNTSSSPSPNTYYGESRENYDSIESWSREGFSGRYASPPRRQERVYYDERQDYYDHDGYYDDQYYREGPPSNRRRFVSPSPPSMGSRHRYQPPSTTSGSTSLPDRFTSPSPPSMSSRQRFQPGSTSTGSESVPESYYSSIASWFRRDDSTIDSARRSTNLVKNHSTWSTATGDTNPQLLHAKAIPGLPPGYLQRKDGVIISVGSSIDNQQISQRYIDPPELMAENVVNDLRQMGYVVDDRNGIMGSTSESTRLSRYGGQPLSTGSAPAVMSNLSEPEPTPFISSVFRARATSDKGSIAGNSNDNSQDSKHRAKVKVDDGKQSVASSSKQKGKPPTMPLPGGASLTSNRSKSKVNGSVASNPKVSKVAASVNSNRSKHSGSAGSRKKSGNNPEPPIQPGSVASHPNIMSSPSPGQMTNSILQDPAVAEGLAYGSTLSSKEGDSALGNDVGVKVVLEAAASDMGSRVTDKRVLFGGEVPQMTGNGDRVPEMVLSTDDTQQLMSDVTSYQRTMCSSTLSSVTFHNPPPQTQDPYESFFDKILFRCR